MTIEQRAGRILDEMFKLMPLDRAQWSDEALELEEFIIAEFSDCKEGVNA